MKPFFALKSLGRLQCRFFSQAGAVFLACLILSQSVFGELPTNESSVHHPDPSREWLGEEYADSVIALMRRNHPELQLNFDLDQVQILKQMPKDTSTPSSRVVESVGSIRQRYEYTFQQKIVAYARSILPEKFARLISALEEGRSIDLERNTWGKQVILLKWLRAQPDNSITPDKFMEQALLITQGNMINAWILAWNVACEDWMAAGTRNYGLINKFVSLTGERHQWKGAFQFVVVPPNERKEGEASHYVKGQNATFIKVPRYLKMVVTKRGDDFSYLYHRLGVELLTMIIAKETGSAVAGRAAGAVGAVGEFIKFTSTAGLARENKKRISNDITAAKSGARLFALVAKNAPLKTSEDLLKPEHYLRPSPKKYGESYQLKNEQPAVYFGSKVDPKFWQPSMSVEELTYRFFHATRYDSDIFNPVILASGDDYERLHRGLVEYSKSSEQSQTLNGYIQDYLDGMRATPIEADVAQDIDLNTFINQRFASQQDKEFELSEYSNRLRRLLTQVLLEKRKGSVKVLTKTASPKADLSSEEFNQCIQLLK